MRRFLEDFYPVEWAGGQAVVALPVPGGAEAVIRARTRAAASGTELRLVVSAPVVARVLRLVGLDRAVSVYPSLEAAVAAGLPAAAGPRADGGSP
jgi:hypothetical protein